MFLKVLKNFFLKRKLKARLIKARPGASMSLISTVGIIVDESHFSGTDELLRHLQSELPESKIEVIAFSDRVKAGRSQEYPTFDMSAVDYSGTIVNEEVNNFVNHEFDMLLSYYDVEKPLLMLMTDQSSARFKVGFSTVDKRLNHFTISTGTEMHKLFAEELLRYLKILNKI
jgi:hypothetical protein